MAPNTDQEVVRVRELINCLEELGWVAFDVLDVWVREDELEKGFFAAVVRLELLARRFERGLERWYFNSCLDGFS